MADVSKIKDSEGVSYNIKDASARTVQHTATLSASGWVKSDVYYTYNLSLPELSCGSDGTVSPIISYSSNADEYSYITYAEATAGTGIVFTTSVKPNEDIGLIIMDVR